MIGTHLNRYHPLRRNAQERTGTLQDSVGKSGGPRGLPLSVLWLYGGGAAAAWMDTRHLAGWMPQQSMTGNWHNRIGTGMRLTNCVLSMRRRFEA